MTVVSPPSLSGTEIILEIHAEDIIYTGHAIQIQWQTNLSLEGYVLGLPHDFPRPKGWSAQFVGMGDFIGRLAEPIATPRVVAKRYTLDYVQGLEERVAQLEAELADAKAWFK